MVLTSASTVWTSPARVMSSIKPILTADCRSVSRGTQLRQIRRYVSTDTFQALVVALVVTRLDYGNAVLTGLPVYLSRRLQSVLNAVARLIFGLRRSDHVSDARSAYFGCAFRNASSLKWPYLRTRSSTVARHRTLIHSSVWSTYRVDELSAPPTLAALSSHSPTGPPLATEPFLLLVPRSGTVCQRRSDQRHHWTPFAGVRRLICSLCHICNWLTSVSGPCSKSLLRPL